MKNEHILHLAGITTENSLVANPLDPKIVKLLERAMDQISQLRTFYNSNTNRGDTPLEIEKEIWELIKHQR